MKIPSGFVPSSKLAELAFRPNEDEYEPGTPTTMVTDVTMNTEVLLTKEEEEPTNLLANIAFDEVEGEHLDLETAPPEGSRSMSIAAFGCSRVQL